MPPVICYDLSPTFTHGGTLIVVTYEEAVHKLLLPLYEVLVLHSFVVWMTQRLIQTKKTNNCTTILEICLYLICAKIRQGPMLHWAQYSCQ